MTTLGQRLKELRKERDWTQHELAQKSGLDRGYIANLEVDGVANPSAESFLKLSRALGIRPEVLYEAAGYNVGPISGETTPDNPEDLIERLRRIQPRAIPVYDEFPIHLHGEGTDIVDHVYVDRNQITGKNLEGYIAKGDCLYPRINDGEIIIVDRDAEIQPGDIVICVIGDKCHGGKLIDIEKEIYLQNNDDVIKVTDCDNIAKIVLTGHWRVP